MASAVLIMEVMEVGWGGKRRSPSKMHHSSLGQSRQDQRRSLSINLCQKLRAISKGKRHKARSFPDGNAHHGIMLLTFQISENK